MRISDLRAASAADDGEGVYQWRRLTKAVDVFSTGCILFYGLTKGGRLQEEIPDCYPGVMGVSRIPNLACVRCVDDEGVFVYLVGVFQDIHLGTAWNASSTS